LNFPLSAETALNDYIAAIIIGVIEGLTEFLPVSSTAHIRLTQELLDLPLESDYWKMFAIVIQLGAILSVVVYFFQRIVGFIRTFPYGKTGDRRWWNHPLSLVVISFVVTAVPCLFMDKFIGENLERLDVIGCALLIGGVVMWIIDKRYSSRATTQIMEEITINQAVVIGFCQIFSAAFPGVSRSMSTIAGGQVMGLSRPAALEFSFFLSIPVMFAATGYKLLQYLLASPAPISGQQWTVLGIGFVVSFVVALIVVAWFMQWVKNRGFTPFAIYRVIIGAITLAYVM
jgi:undecaprenyl-diphosphatase